jgi:hypothetical protein
MLRLRSGFNRYERPKNWYFELGLRTFTKSHSDNVEAMWADAKVTMYNVAIDAIAEWVHLDMCHYIQILSSSSVCTSAFFARKIRSCSEMNHHSTRTVQYDAFFSLDLIRRVIERITREPKYLVLEGSYCTMKQSTVRVATS